MYTLFSLNSRGTTPDTFLTPPVIDDQYMPGYTWARQTGLRISQNFTKEFQVAYGAETSYTSWPGGSLPALAVNGTVAPVPANVVSQTLPGVLLPGAYLQAPVGGSLYYNGNNISFSHVPDQIVKAAWDPEFYGHSIHVEGGGILRQFTDRTYGGNHDVWGGGGFASVVVQVVPKWLDFQASGISGSGISRYGACEPVHPGRGLQLDGRLKPDPRAPGHGRLDGPPRQSDGRLCLRRRRIRRPKLVRRKIPQDALRLAPRQYLRLRLWQPGLREPGL